MASHFVHPRFRAFFTTSALVAALLLALPLAASAQQDKPQANPEQAKTERAKRHGPMTAEQIEQHITQLHGQLQITATQETAWSAFAQVMREGSARMNTLVAKWSQEKGTRSAVENLKAHEEMAEEHAQNLHKLVPAFEAVYASMSAEQKKIADRAFIYAKKPKTPKGEQQ